MNPHDRETRKAEFPDRRNDADYRRAKLAKYIEAYGGTSKAVALRKALERYPTPKQSNFADNPYKVFNPDSLSELQGFGRPRRPPSPLTTALFVLVGLVMLAIAIYFGD